MINYRLHKITQTFFLFSVFCFLSSVCCAQETLTITTYYPSPSGSYNELGTNKLAVDITGVAVPSEYAAMQNGDVHIGRALIVGAGGGSGFAFDELIGPPDNRPGDGDVLIKGNVGIGTTAPAGRLHVVGPDDAASAVAFMPGADTLVAGTPSLNVGIGTTSPATKLDVVVPSGEGVATMPAVRIRNLDSGVARHGLLVDTANSSNSTYALDVRGGAATKFYVRSDGRVGIGTDTPAGTLDVRGWTATGSNDGIPIRFLAQNGGPTGNTDGGDIILIPGSPNNNGLPGRVGIGTSNPSSPLDLRYTMQQAGIRYGLVLTRTDSDSPGSNGLGTGIIFRLEDSNENIEPAGTIGVVWENATNGSEQASMRFNTMQAGTVQEAMRIDDNGNVGIGTTSPAATLDVNGSVSVGSGNIQIYRCPQDYGLSCPGGGDWASYGCLGQLSTVSYCSNYCWAGGMTVFTLNCTLTSLLVN